jgi:hypothetical protein
MLFSSLIEFFSYVFKLLQATSQQEDDGGEEEIPEDASPKQVYKWFLKKLKDDKAKDVAQNKDPFFQPGKVYIFKYKPFYKEKYSFWDEHPVVVSLGKMPSKQGYMNVGLNLSWFPPSARKYFMDEIKKVYKAQMQESIKKKPGDAIEQKGLPIDLYALKMRLDQFGFSWAIRNYLPSQIMSPSVVMSFEHWDKCSKFDVPSVFPELKGDGKLFDIYKDFEDYVKWNRTNKTATNKKTELAQKAGRYKFEK